MATKYWDGDGWKGDYLASQKDNMHRIYYECGCYVDVKDLDFVPRDCKEHNKRIITSTY